MISDKLEKDYASRRCSNGLVPRNVIGIGKKMVSGHELE
jgi:hypothetical protein